MPLTIHLENPLAVYSGNEVIRGRVVLECSNVVNAHDVRVTFSGRSKTTVKQIIRSAFPSADYRSKCVLFEKEHILMCPNGGTILPDTYEWPFEFEFPSHTELGGEWPKDSLFRSDANHPLPPSFAAEGSGPLGTLECEIEYRIRAQVLKPQKDFWGKRAPLFDKIVRLNFVPLAAQVDKESHLPYRYEKKSERLFRINSLRLLPESRRQNPVMQKKSRWTSSSPPPLLRFFFQVSFIYSTQVFPSMPLPCVLEIMPLIEHGDVPTAPDIVLQSVRMDVASYTYARALPSMMGKIYSSATDPIEVIPKTTVGVPVSGRVDLNEMFGPLVFQNADVSFNTFNVSRSYELSASFIFQCAGETLECNFDGLDINVLADAQELSGKAKLAETKLEAQGVGTMDSQCLPSSHDDHDYEKNPPPYASIASDSTASLEKGHK